jgi:hypothetical protein
LRALTPPAFIKRLGAVAVLAGAAVCVLEGLPDAAAGADGGESAAPAGPAPDPGLPPAANPDAGGNVFMRRHMRRWKRAGAQGGPDGGAPAAGDGGVAAVSRDAGRDGIARIAMPLRPAVAPVPPPPPPPPPPPMPTKPSTSQPVTDLGFNTCQKIPRGKRIVKVTLKPEVELPELVAWISSITCKTFVLPGHLSSGGKKVTFIAQGAMTRDEAFAAFLTALDSLGLTIERGPGYFKIIETAKAKTSSVPVYGFDGQPTRGKE